MTEFVGIPTLAPFLCNLAQCFVRNVISWISVFLQARNLAVKMEFKESDELIAKPLKSIYSKDGSCTMTTTLITPVLYHNTTPTFYEEVRNHLIFELFSFLFPNVKNISGYFATLGDYFSSLLLPGLPCFLNKNVTYLKHNSVSCFDRHRNSK